MFKKILIAVIAVTLVSISLASHEKVASAGQADFQYGYTYGQAFCKLEYGYSQWLHTISPVFQYCPYGPQPNYSSDASDAARMALAASCSGILQNWGFGFDGYHNSFSVAQAAQNNYCTNGCTTMAWSGGGYYSTYNNPANCHP